MLKRFVFLIAVFSAAAEISQAGTNPAGQSGSQEPTAPKEKILSASGIAPYRLYNFSPKLLQAITECSNYTENFLDGNPNFKQELSQTYHIDNPEIIVNFEGLKDDFCRFKVEEKFPPVQTEYSCQITMPQLKELEEAAKDRSTEPYTETFSIYPEPDENGVIGEPINNTVTDSRFKVVWERIKNESCLQNTVESPAETEQQSEIISIEDPSDFSADFLLSLYNCQPDTEEQKITIPERLDIIGPKDGKCLLRYDVFDLNVPQQLLVSIHSMSDIRRLLQNRDITSYRPSYDYHGLLYEINECLQNRSTHTASLQRREEGEITIISGLTSQFANDICSIRLLNQVNTGTGLTDYSVTCQISPEDAQFIVDTYPQLLKDATPAETAESKQADDEIMYRLQQMNFCHKTQEK